MAAGRHGEVLLEEMRTKKETDKETVERFGNISSIERYVVWIFCFLTSFVRKPIAYC